MLSIKNFLAKWNMTRHVYETKIQTRRAAYALHDAKVDLQEGMTISEAVSKHHLSNSPTSSLSPFHRWYKIPTPATAKCKSGFYLKRSHETNLSISRTWEGGDNYTYTKTVHIFWVLRANWNYKNCLRGQKMKYASRSMRIIESAC